MTSRRASILVADDEVAIADLVARIMRDEGMSAKAVYGGRAALAEIKSGPYDLAILDVMMPDLDGFEVCRRARATTDIPIVFLTAKDEDIDQIVGLSIGGDDYVVKPFKPKVLAARVKARLRPRLPRDSGHLEIEGLDLDVSMHEVSLHGVPVKLTPKEFGILHELIRADGGTVPAKDLYESVWDEPFDQFARNSVMVHIRRLREKLSSVDASKEIISTVWGIGYRIKCGKGERGRGED